MALEEEDNIFSPEEDFFADTGIVESDDDEEEGDEEDSGGGQEEILKEGYLDSRFQLNFHDRLDVFGSDFAVACRAVNKKNPKTEHYALVFDPRYPVPLAMVHKFQKEPPANISRIVSSGKIDLSGQEQLVVIMEMPTGRSLLQVIKEDGPIDEMTISNDIVYGLNKALSDMEDRRITCGNINLGNIFYDRVSGQVTIKEFFSEFNGYTQSNAYETLARAMCNKTAKGYRDDSADSYAIGVVVASLITGAEPFKGVEEEAILERRLQAGSYDTTMEDLMKHSPRFSQRSKQLLKALLTDVDKERWQSGELQVWLNKQNQSIIFSTIHKQTSSPFTFEGKEYFGIRHLAYGISTNWTKAKVALRTSDLSRWLRLNIKQSKLADAVDGLMGVGKETTIIPDSQLARLIHILDSKGPLRYGGKYAINIYGMGSFIAYGYLKGKKEYLQQIGDLFNENMVDNWISLQNNPEMYSYSMLLWSPTKEAKYIKQKFFGFGIERILYDLNPSLPCQSKLLKGKYIIDLNELLSTLNELSSTKSEESDPVDRHIAAFIGNRIDLLDEIRVRAIQRYPVLARSPHLSMLALLTVAQGQSRLHSLKGLCSWLNSRLEPLFNSFHSKTIIKQLKKEIERGTKEGSLGNVFKVVSDAKYIRMDQSGFKQASRQYRKYAQSISDLEKQSNLEKLAYHLGLKTSLMLAYLVLAITVVISLFRIN